MPLVSFWITCSIICTIGFLVTDMLHFFCCPPDGSGFKPDPSIMDFGQSSPEDEDLYSTRSWETTAGSRRKLIPTLPSLISSRLTNTLYHYAE